MNTTIKKGLIYDIQPFSIQDGPGIRTTVFLKGCPLRCPWCHSPESQEFHPQLCWISMRCTGCHTCISKCPNQAITVPFTKNSTESSPSLCQISINRGKCVNCGTCTQTCLPQALFLSGSEYTADQVLEIVQKDLPFYRTSGGGVTISGGEALSQPEFTLELLKALKTLNIHTAIDTTGFAGTEIIHQILPLTDLFLYDLKHMDSKIHKTITGVPNEQILNNARLIAASGGKLQIRIPLITGFNTDIYNLRAAAEFCRQIQQSITAIQLLPYHDLGNAKYPRLGRETNIFTTAPVTDECIQQCKEIFSSVKVPVTVH